MKRWALRLGLLLAAAGLGGFLVAASGIISLTASSGHWAVTRWFLHFAMRRSVATHALPITAPPLDEPWLAVKGAAHYDTGCRPCHGSPELPRPRTPQGMTPEPPYLPPRIPEWTPERLFYIVKHGIKFTGMPAWPAAGRDDEVWALVAFLLRYPGLTAEEYRRLARGGMASREQRVVRGVPPAVEESCRRCHGVDGLGRGGGAFPKLAGQSPAYLSAALQAYAGGARYSGVMEPIAAALSPGETEEVAGYYGSLPGGAAAARPEDARAVERGRAIANSGIPTRRVPACAACHGPKTTPRNPAYPVLAGQYPDYLALQLTLFKSQTRGGTPYAELMRHVAPGLTAEQVRDVALYYGSLPLHLSR